MIQGFDPRAGEPVGEPVAETTDAEVDALVRAGAAAAPEGKAATASRATSVLRNVAMLHSRRCGCDG